jgi:hypothetical protein
MKKENSMAATPRTQAPSAATSPCYNVAETVSTTLASRTYLANREADAIHFLLDELLNGGGPSVGPATQPPQGSLNIEIEMLLNSIGVIHTRLRSLLDITGQVV